MVFGVGRLVPRSGVSDRGHILRIGMRLRWAKFQTPNAKQKTSNKVPPDFLHPRAEVVEPRGFEPLTS